MADDFTVQIKMPPQEMRDFDSLLQEIAREHSKSLPQIVPQVGRFFAQSAGAATPISKKRRPVETNPDRTGRGATAKGKRYRFPVFTQRRPMRWFTTDVRMDPRRLIKRRGTARNVWRAMIGKMGQKGSLTGEAAAHDAGRKFAAVSVVKASDAYQVTLTNSIAYAAKITPNVLSQSMAKALKRMNTMLVKRKQRQEAQFRT